VPRFHITWGTGPALVDIFAGRLRDRPRVRFAYRHRVDELIVDRGAVTGVRYWNQLSSRAVWRRRETPSATSSATHRP
jgi:predicted oxidoreductase